MISLVKRLIGADKKEDSHVSFDEGIVFLERNGVDTSKLDFPNSKFRSSEEHFMKYYCHFSRLNARMIKDDSDKAVTVVSGHYHSQAACGGQRENGSWIQAWPAEYVFSIKDNNFELKRREVY